jgi:hypothetical protein
MAKWIEDEIGLARIPDHLHRAYRHWRAGVNPTEESVDLFCARSGFLHLDDVPAWAILGWPKEAVAGLDLEITNGKRWLVRRVADA